MFKLLHKVTPVWAVTFLFAWTGLLHAADAPPPSPLQAGLAAYEQGDYATAIAQLQKPAGEGDRDALYYLGEAVLFDTARPGYMTRAYNVHKLGAEAGDVGPRHVVERVKVFIPACIHSGDVDDRCHQANRPRLL